MPLQAFKLRTTGTKQRRRSIVSTGSIQVTYFCQEHVRHSLSHKICPPHTF